MSDHYHQHMTMPCRVGPCFIVRHAKIAFTFLKALFNWPSHCGQPIKRCLIGGSGCVAHKIFDSSIFIPAYIEPNLFPRCGIVSVFCRTDAGYTSNAFYVSINWPFCPFRQCSLCPFNLKQAIRYHLVNQFWSNCIFRLKLCVFRYLAVFPFVPVFFWKPVLW